VCFRTKGVVLRKSHGVERVQNPGSVFNMGGKQNGGEGTTMGYIYSSSCDMLVHFILLVKEHKTAQPSSYRTTRHHMNEEPRNEIWYSWRGQYSMPRVAFASLTTFNAQTSCISEHTE
jgi:hypothetical protein